MVVTDKYYLYMDQSKSDGEDKTEGDDVPYNETEVEYDEFFMLPYKENL